MILYRQATAEDADQIAQLHTLSWQQNYRGIWKDDFLNGPVRENRQDVWQKRLTQPTPNQHVMVADLNGKICGFACAYADENPVWGTLLDNLHVHSDQKGHGVGTVLIKSTARWSYQTNPESGFYLWVLSQNSSARQFYERLGATNYEQITHENPGGGFSDACRYVWPDVKKLIG